MPGDPHARNELVVIRRLVVETEALSNVADGLHARRQREAHPQASIYNLMVALEWRSAPGPLANFGDLVGNMMVRRTVFEALGGFRPEVIAGEDSEFGVRVGLAGHRACKLDALPDPGLAGSFCRSDGTGNHVSV